MDKILLAQGVLLQLVLLGLEVLGVRLGAAEHLEKITLGLEMERKGTLNMFCRKRSSSPLRNLSTQCVTLSKRHTVCSQVPQLTRGSVNLTTQCVTHLSSSISSMPTIHQSIQPFIHPSPPSQYQLAKVGEIDQTLPAKWTQIIS